MLPQVEDPSAIAAEYLRTDFALDLLGVFPWELLVGTAARGLC